MVTEQEAYWRLANKQIKILLISTIHSYWYTVLITLYKSAHSSKMIKMKNRLGTLQVPQAWSSCMQYI